MNQEMMLPNVIGWWRVRGELRVLLGRRKKGLLVPVLLYGSSTMVWREIERSMIGVVEMDNISGLLCIRRMDRVPNARLRDLCRVREEVN